MKYCKNKFYVLPNCNLFIFRICDQLHKVAGNDICCDCLTPKPTWASINLGVTLCIGKYNF